MVSIEQKGLKMNNRIINFRVWDLTAKRFCHLNNPYFETTLKPDSESGEMKFHGRLTTSFCGAYKHKGEGEEILPEGITGYSHLDKNYEFPAYSSKSQKDKYVIQQFTGLFDKNNRRIYEGDIVSINTPYTEPVLDDGTGPEFDHFNIDSVICQNGCFGVMFDEGQPASSPRLHFATFNWLLNDFGTDSIEVIGNIFENPELLVSESE